MYRLFPSSEIRTLDVQRKYTSKFRSQNTRSIGTVKVSKFRTLDKVQKLEHETKTDTIPKKDKIKNISKYPFQHTRSNETLKKNKSSSQRTSLNRSQYGGCSTTYNTQTSTQVVYGRFGTYASHLEGLDSEPGTHSLDVPQDAPNRIGLVARVVCPVRGRCTLRLNLPTDAQGANGIVAVTRRDSDLEAFSHNPTDGSFAPLATRPSTCTKCPNLRFLSY